MVIIFVLKQEVSAWDPSVLTGLVSRAPHSFSLGAAFLHCSVWAYEPSFLAVYTDVCLLFPSKLSLPESCAHSLTVPLIASSAVSNSLETYLYQIPTRFICCNCKPVSQFPCNFYLLESLSEYSWHADSEWLLVSVWLRARDEGVRHW